MTRILKVFSIFLLLSIIVVTTDIACSRDGIRTDQDWPMFKYDIQRTGSPDDFDFNDIELLWKYQFEIFEEGGSIRVSPAVTSDVVIVPTRFYVNCLDANTGELIWRKYLGENNSSPIIYRGNVIISATNTIYSLRINDGYQNWTKDLVKEGYLIAGISVPAAADGKIYYGLRGKDNADGYLYCLNEKDGATIWRYQVFGPVRTAPVVVRSKVIFGADDGIVHCLDNDTGERLWTYYTGDIIRSSPAVYDNKIYLGSNSAYMHCLNLDDGKLLWKFETGDIINSTPGISQGKLFFSSNDKNVYCLDSETGALIWEYNYGNLTFTSPTICANKIFLGTDDLIYCLDSENGSLKWRYRLDDSSVGTPMSIHNGKLYFRTAGFAYCFVLK